MGTFINYIQPNDHIQPAFVFISFTDGTLQLPETNVAFAISATGTEAQETHEFIKDIIKSIITTYGTRKLQYSVIVYGDSVSPEVTFGDVFKSDADLVKAIDSIPGITGSPSFDKALEEAKEQLLNPFLRPYAAKVGSLHCDLVLTCLDIFKKKDFSTFSIKYVSTRSLFQSFLPVHTRTLKHRMRCYRIPKPPFLSLLTKTICWYYKNPILGTVFENLHFWTLKTQFTFERKASDIGYQTSDIRHRTSWDIRHQTSDIRHRTPDIRQRTSDVRHGTLDIRHQTLNIGHRT